MRRVFLSFSAGIISLEILGLALLSVGAGLIYVPAGLIVAGASMIVVAIAVERNNV